MHRVRSPDRVFAAGSLATVLLIALWPRVQACRLCVDNNSCLLVQLAVSEHLGSEIMLATTSKVVDLAVVLPVTGHAEEHRDVLLG